MPCGVLGSWPSARERKGMVGGQCIDLDSEGKTVDLDLLREMDLGKTVALISAACQMGCVAAGAGEDALENARRYAEGVGMALPDPG